jgi:HPt (histidine-containing phosphotransfer) domain-containing protein
MDEYLTKPLELRQLQAALSRWLPAGVAPDTAPGPLGSPAQQTQGGVDGAAHAVDVAVLKDLIGDDPQLVRRFLTEFRAQAGRLAAELKATDDKRQIGEIAHKLKSTSRSVGALALGDLCAELENACRTDSREGIEHGVTEFEAAMLAVDTEIGELLDHG